ncbi:MAG: adenylate/guanylate cyclase domain-containing protein [Chloroflexota bacterium]
MMVHRLRLATGIMLMTYVTSHLMNHAFGLISLEAAESGRQWFIACWRHPVGTALLYGSLLTHVSLALWAIYNRRHFRIPRWEIIRLGLGLSIPYFLLQHAFGTRMLHEVTGIQDTYTRQMVFFWVLQPARGAQQVLLLTIAWMHGCLGLHYWLRVKPRRALTLRMLQFLGGLIPLLGIGGFIDMGQEVSALAGDPDWIPLAFPTPSQADSERVAFWRDLVTGIFVTAVAATFLAREARSIREKRGKAIEITYSSGQRVRVALGTTLLEASRSAGIPHASLCGGRGRCSTCRSRITGPPGALPPPSDDEARVLRRIGARPDVRLACQVRPRADVRAFPLFPPSGHLPRNVLHPTESEGVEREVVILFADLRGYSGLAEQRLPFDVVFLLNQYFASMGSAIESAGGHLDKFIGDGIMALFGLREPADQACRHALEAAALMSRALDRMNDSLADDLNEPLRIGIGIHVGSVIVGELGYGRARAMTAVGDAVNIASRLETLTKEYQVQLVLSAEVARMAGIDIPGRAHHDVPIPGRIDPLTVFAISVAADLTTGIPGAPGLSPHAEG